MPGFLAGTGTDLFDLYDIIGASYGILPCQVADLEWDDLMITVQSLRSRSDRIKKMIRRNRTKKSTVFPNISLSEIADLL